VGGVTFCYYGSKVIIPEGAAPDRYKKNNILDIKIIQDQVTSYTESSNCSEKLKKWQSLHSIVTILLENHIINRGTYWIKMMIFTEGFMDTDFE
jgi:hypothetical protein